eukprot:TRINITY_DN22234_c0_g2_i1.p1 TRINITY_DN22234_c0_g2~~TRINITY_DN22234_c0_g2_i1.p1  ORF type:complete len:337 (-),score=41.99 TRINITY_DN22234_c0_g2_i1:79-1026(-)
MTITGVVLMYGVVLSKSQLKDVLEHQRDVPKQVKRGDKTTCQWAAQDTLVVTVEFSTRANDNNIELKPGMKGVVNRVDDDGDLEVRFDSFPRGLYRVTNEDFPNLSKLKARRISHERYADVKNTRTVTVTFMSGEVFEIDRIREGTVSGDLVRTIVRDQKHKKYVVNTHLLDGDRMIPDDEVLAGTSFTAVESFKTSEELDKAIENDPHDCVGQLATALGLQGQMCPHDLARDECIFFLGASRPICSPGGPFEGMSNMNEVIQGSEVERVAGIIQDQVLPALKAPDQAVKMAGYRVRPPSSAQYYVWPNDCQCCS